MKVYTSYFKNMSRINRDDYTLVSIANSEPRGFTVDAKIGDAVPFWSLVEGYKDGSISWEQYEEEYTEYVSKHLEKIRNVIRCIYQMHGKPVILLCWEGKDKHCHRHILAKLLDMDVEELTC